MMIHDVTIVAGKKKRRKRIGKGIGSGSGKTAGRGTKGAGSRSGWAGSIRPSREGGQMPFFRRIPKRGFSNFNFRVEYIGINLELLNETFMDGDEVNPELLIKAGLLDNTKVPVKILGTGTLTKKLNIWADAFTKSAVEKVTAAGGNATVIHRPAATEAK